MVGARIEAPNRGVSAAPTVNSGMCKKSCAITNRPGYVLWLWPTLVTRRVRKTYLTTYSERHAIHNCRRLVSLAIIIRFSRSLQHTRHADSGRTGAARANAQIRTSGYARFSDRTPN